MRSQRAIKNIVFSFFSALLSLGLTLINRKAILGYLGVEMLGYESLFANVFSVLSFSEMGAATVIAYQLYRSVANKDIEEMNILVSMYKYLYRVIGIIIALLGLIFFRFLRYVVTDYTVPWQFVQKIYLIQLIATVASYFLTYKRMLFIANQQEYIIIKTDMIINFITQIFKILIIVFWQNYIFYLIICVSKAIVVNIIVQIKAGLAYPEYRNVKISLIDFKKRNIFKDMSNFMGQKIASVLYYNTDNILISMLLGVSVVGVYSNYYTIKSQVFRLTIRLLNPIQASIGNYINDPDKRPEQGLQLFNTLDIVSYAIALVFSCCLYNMIQSFIILWYGEDHVLSNSVVFLLVVNTYIETLREIPYYFRSAFGQYEIDRKYAVLSAASNIILTMFLGRIMGLCGVLIGTVVGMFFLWHGVIKFLFKVYLKTSVKMYYLKHLKLLFVSGFAIFLTGSICSYIPTTIIGLIIKAIISCIIPGLIALSVFWKTEEIRRLITYVSKIASKVF